ncbi:MAG: hypothetical protein AAF203_01275 [Pseudomonadota bacterium]
MRFVLILMTLLVSSLGFAQKKICINTWVAYEPNGKVFKASLRGNHAYISIEENEKKILCMGFYYDVSINNCTVNEAVKGYASADSPVRKHENWHHLVDEKHCVPFNQQSLSTIKWEAQNWTKNKGEYSYFNNNCTKFATHMYNKYSDDHIPSGILDLPHPNRVADLIQKARLQGVQKLRDVDPDLTEVPDFPVNQESRFGCPPSARSAFVDEDGHCYYDPSDSDAGV